MTKPARAAAAGVDVARLGIYFTPAEFDLAKRAYLGDWQAGGEANTFSRWIASVIEAHARRSPTDRAALGRDPVRSATTTGQGRTFNVSSGTLEQLRIAQAADQAAGRFVSDSHWCGEAVRVAVIDASARAGGSLPPAPARLPQRLIRVR